MIDFVDLSSAVSNAVCTSSSGKRWVTSERAAPVVGDDFERHLVVGTAVARRVDHGADDLDFRPRQVTPVDGERGNGEHAEHQYAPFRPHRTLCLYQRVALTADRFHGDVDGP